MAKVKKRRQQRATLLVVGEGDCDVAFLKHLRSLYCSDKQGVNITVRNAHGKGPENVVDSARRELGGYDKRVAFLDTDIQWTEALRKVARKLEIEMVGSEPCLEGLLLRTLGEPVREGAGSDVLKRQLQVLTGKSMTEHGHYVAHFSRDTLEEARGRIDELEKLISLFKGNEFLARQP